MPPPRVRVHGYNRPFHPLQVATWIVFPLLIGLFYGVCVPNFQTMGERVGLGVIVALAAGAVMGLGFYTGYTDPVAGTAPAESDYYCTVCNRPVNTGALHCRLCNKCVERFDHHCLWLNTCIGEKNYAAFVQLLAFTTLFVSIQLGCAAYAMSRVVAQNGYLSGSTLLPAFGLLVVYLVLLVLIFGNVVNLLLFHIVLISKKETTYSSIVRKHRTRMERRSAKKKKNSHHHTPPPSHQPPEQIEEEEGEKQQDEMVELGSPPTSKHAVPNVILTAEIGQT